MEYIKKCWNGGERLWKMYWLWGVLVGFLAGFVFSFINALVLQGQSGLWALLIMIPLCFVYEVWWIVSTWRCSPNASLKLWTILAKIVIVLHVIYLLAVGYAFILQNNLS